jgi:hypothetical protein
MPWRCMGEWMYRFTFLTLALVGGEWSASLQGRFTPKERAPNTHWIGGWVGPSAGLDDVEKKIFLIILGFELRPLGCLARSQSLYWLRRFRCLANLYKLVHILCWILTSLCPTVYFYALSCRFSWNSDLWSYISARLLYCHNYYLCIIILVLLSFIII